MKTNKKLIESFKNQKIDLNRTKNVFGGALTMGVTQDGASKVATVYAGDTKDGFVGNALVSYDCECKATT